MRIAIDFGVLHPRILFGFAEVYRDMFLSIASQQPGHQFIFLEDESYQPTASTAENVETIIFKLKGKSWPLSRWWGKYKIAGILKKHRVDVWVSADDIFFSRPVVRNILFIPGLTSPDGKTNLKKSASTTANKVRAICTTTQFFKQEIINKYQVPDKNVYNVGAFVQQMFTPVEWSNREIIKEAYADGYEYFLLISHYAEENVIASLKAFSIFKKWQKTNMKLLIVHSPTKRDALAEQLKTFKYRDDVKLLKNLSNDEIAKIFAGAYAVLFPCSAEVFPLPILQAMQGKVPAITTPIASITEVGSDAVLYTDFKNPKETAEQMKKVYKDEQLRNVLIERGIERSLLYSLENTTALMWKAIEQAVSE